MTAQAEQIEAAAEKAAAEEAAPEAPRLREHSPKKQWLPGPLVLRFFSPLLLLALWQVLSSAGILSERTLPAPAQIFAAAQELWGTGELQDNLAISLQRVVLGAALGLAAALLSGVAVGFSKVIEVLLDPPLQMLRTVPFLGLIPLFVIWFGIGEEPKVLMVAQATFFPLYVAIFAGVRGADPKLLEAGRTLKLNKAQLAWHVVLPGAVAQALTGLRLSLGVAWLALIVAEQINADSGIGYLVMNARTFLRIDIVVLGLVIYALLGLATDGLVRVLERRLLRWQSKNQVR